MLGDTHWLGSLAAAKGSANGSGRDPSGPELHGVTHAALVNWSAEASESVGGGLGARGWVAVVGGSLMALGGVVLRWLAANVGPWAGWLIGSRAAATGGVRRCGVLGGFWFITCVFSFLLLPPFPYSLLPFFPYSLLIQLYLLLYLNMLKCDKSKHLFNLFSFLLFRHNCNHILSNCINCDISMTWISPMIFCVIT